MSYVHLGKAAPLSGVRRSASSSPPSWRRKPPGRTVYILDEPTTGLRFADIHKLLECCKLRDSATRSSSSSTISSD